VDARETVTDENGEFRVGGEWHLLTDSGGEPWGSVYIYKPGYKIFGMPWHNFPNCYWCFEPRMTDPPHYIYKIARVKSVKERLENLRLPHDIPMSLERKLTIWTRISKEEEKKIQEMAQKKFFGGDTDE
jgi:hypothetical protein